MFSFRKRDKHSTASGARQKGGGPSQQPVETAPRNTGNQPSQGTRDPPAPIGWSPSSGAPQAAYPLGSSTQQQQRQQQQQQQQQGGNAHAQPGDSFFPGGFILPGSHNSSSPRSSRSSSVSSHHRPQPLGNGFAQQQQQPPPADPGPPNVNNDECFAWFLSVDQDGKGQLSSEELRSALLNDGGLSFSTTTVKYLMSTFKLDGNDRIGFEDFEPLWNYITQWRQMFESFDADRDGKIDANELGQALAYYNLHVGRPILDMLVKKYGITITSPTNQNPRQPPRLRLDLDHFVCACVVVRQMCELYDKTTAGVPTSGQPRISRDEFLQDVIALP